MMPATCPWCIWPRLSLPAVGAPLPGRTGAGDRAGIRTDPMSSMVLCLPVGREVRVVLCCCCSTWWPQGRQLYRPSGLSGLVGVASLIQSHQAWIDWE